MISLQNVSLVKFSELKLHKKYVLNILNLYIYKQYIINKIINKPVFLKKNTFFKVDGKSDYVTVCF